MKKLFIAITIFFCIGLITYIIKQQLESNKKYYVVSLHSFYENSSTAGPNDAIEEIKKIGKIENDIRISRLVFISSFKPIEIEKEKQRNKNIEEIKEITYYKTGIHAKYDIFIEEKNENFIQHLEKEIPIVYIEKTIGKDVLLEGILTEEQFEKLKNDSLIKKINLHEEIPVD